MTKDEAYEKRRQECLALARENKKLKKMLAEVDAGTYTVPEKAANLKARNKEHQEMLHWKKEAERFKNNWQQQVKITENFKIAARDAQLDKEDIEKERDEYKAKCEELQSRLDAILGSDSSDNKDLLDQINALKEELQKEKAKNDTDGTNSGLPTSKTPIGKNKVIPNLREKSELKRGGQPGHEKHSLAPIPDNKINDDRYHILTECPSCGSRNLEYVDCIDKDEIDFEIKIINRRHHFYVYKCLDCGKIVHSSIPLHLKEQTQYGSNIKAMILALLDLGYISINRAKRLIDGFLGNGISISEGFICKQQRRASLGLKSFVEAVRLEIIKSHVVHWDDTVIFVNTKRGCMRFYGNNKLALFKAHETKARDGLDEDAVLGALGPDTVVVHDHVLVNYNDDFYFENAECNQHLERDLKSLNDICHHSWASQLNELIASTIHERNQIIASGGDSFPRSKYRDVIHQVDKIMTVATSEHEESTGHFYESDERRLMNRINDYKKNYFLWVKDFDVPPTNNLAERGLRGQKTKLKVSGQYQSVESAGYFADIRTYLETCLRNGVNEVTALQRLTSGNPFTLNELLGGA